MNAHDTAHDVLEHMASEEFIVRVVAQEEAGYEWVFDPQVEGVLGLIPVGKTQPAIVVVYINDGPDFEYDASVFA